MRGPAAPRGATELVGALLVLGLRLGSSPAVRTPPLATRTTSESTSEATLALDSPTMLPTPTCPVPSMSTKSLVDPTSANECWMAAAWLSAVILPSMKRLV